ncbi:MAG: nuclear transport factor 2 family protein [Acidimicrobiia bacterium]|nr:nuclear transport factor 2 family protein [Acidimicrobiia bacterium]
MSDNRQLITEAFAAWAEGDSRPFFALVHDDVTWTVIGSTTISGTFEGKRAFLDGAIAPMGKALATPLRAEVLGVLADGDEVAVRWVGRSSSRTGRPYVQTYCWVMRLAAGRVVEVTAYLDTELLTAVLADAAAG